MMRTEQLKLLQRLAGLRADRAAARLARVQGLIDTLEERAAKLRDAPAADMSNIANAMAQDRWDAWRIQNLTLINTQIARLNVAAQPQRENLARETARTRVLEKLTEKR